LFGRRARVQMVRPQPAGTVARWHKILIAAMTGTILLLTWRLGLGKPVLAVPPDQDVLGAA